MISDRVALTSDANIYKPPQIGSELSLDSLDIFRLACSSSFVLSVAKRSYSWHSTGGVGTNQGIGRSVVSYLD